MMMSIVTAAKNVLLDVQMTFSRRKVGNNNQEWEVTVVHEDGTEKQYRGSSTVWYSYPEAQQNSHMDMFIVRLMKLMDWGIYEDD